MVFGFTLLLCLWFWDGWLGLTIHDVFNNTTSIFSGTMDETCLQYGMKFIYFEKPKDAD